MRAQRPGNQKGMVLLEFFIVIALLGIFLPMMVPDWPEITATRLSDATVEDSLAFWDASRNYYARQGTWPDEVNNCASAIAVLEASGGLGGVSTTNPWGGAVTTACNPGDAALMLSQETHVEWQGYIVNSLPATQAGAGTAVNTIIPAPGTSAQSQSQLSRIAVAGRPELNRMETNIDMDGHNIDRAGEIESDHISVNVDLVNTATGVSMSESGRKVLHNFDTAWGSGFVEAPSCPATKPTPTWLATPKQICTDPNATRAMESWWFEASNVPGGWRIRPVIFSQNSHYRPVQPACSQFYVETFCQ